MGKLQPTGQNLGWVFNFRYGHLHGEHFWYYQVKLPNLKWKTRPKQLLGSLPLVIALPGPNNVPFKRSTIGSWLTLKYYKAVKAYWWRNALAYGSFASTLTVKSLIEIRHLKLRQKFIDDLGRCFKTFFLRYSLRGQNKLERLYLTSFF